jgi:hypothetical protein
VAFLCAPSTRKEPSWDLEIPCMVHDSASLCRIPASLVLVCWIPHRRHQSVHYLKIQQHQEGLQVYASPNVPNPLLIVSSLIAHGLRCPAPIWIQPECFSKLSTSKFLSFSGLLLFLDSLCAARFRFVKD